MTMRTIKGGLAAFYVYDLLHFTLIIIATIGDKRWTRYKIYLGILQEFKRSLLHSVKTSIVNVLLIKYHHIYERCEATIRLLLLKICVMWEWKQTT